MVMSAIKPITSTKKQSAHPNHTANTSGIQMCSAETYHQQVQACVAN